MGMVLVNGRVDGAVKRRAEKVLAAHSKTPSEAIRALYRELAETRELPAFLAADPGAERAERQRRLAILRSVEGLSHSDLLAGDAATERVLRDEIERRHG
jgi:antitoxin component of RelBE/YafQ-DinJ toxin-antitoxin module